MPYLSGRGSTTWAGPCSSAAPFSLWHRVHGQAVVEWGFPRWVPWWVAHHYGWQIWRYASAPSAKLQQLRSIASPPYFVWPRRCVSRALTDQH